MIKMSVGTIDAIPDELFYLEALQYADFPTLYRYRNVPAVEALYLDRTATGTDVIEQLLVAIDYDDLALFQVAFGRLTEPTRKRGLVHVVLNQATSTTTPPMHIVTWFVESILSRRFRDVFFSSVCHSHLEMDIALVTILAEDDQLRPLIAEYLGQQISASQGELPRLQIAIPEIRELARVNKDDSILYTRAINAFRRVSTLLTRHLVDPSVTVTEQSLSVYDGLYQLIADSPVETSQGISDTIYSLGLYLHLEPNVNLDLYEIWHRRLFNTSWYRTTQHALMDTGRYGEVFDFIDAEIFSLESYLFFVGWYLADPEAWLRIMVEHDAARDMQTKRRHEYIGILLIRLGVRDDYRMRGIARYRKVNHFDRRTTRRLAQGLLQGYDEALRIGVDKPYGLTGEDISTLQLLSQ